jgi:hypothetical protein
VKKSLTKFLILTIILTAALSVNYLFAAWVGPTQAPPGGNTSTPIHVGSTNQVKDGGLSLDALSVFGGGYFQGNVGIGVVSPMEALDIAGNIRVSNLTSCDFLATDSNGKIICANEIIQESTETICINTGGSWETVQSLCYFSGSSCSSGWTPYANYSSSQSRTSAGNRQECTTGGHYRMNLPLESCGYSGDALGNSGTLSAIQTETGCTKN